ncbi:MAG: aminopeptidase [Woeseiaceae bacterium]
MGGLTSLIRFLLLVTIAASLSGCFYTQAARGQLELMRKRESIEELINDPDTSEELVARLKLVQEAREFSIAELGLPDNDSYRTYADLERDYVLWNVFAAEEFSMSPRTWCYPIVGCVSYRGYFKKDKAESLAQDLEDKDYDVYLAGVSAYSTLGKFSDPVVNTMMNWNDSRLVAVLFHELAHQVLYIRDDTGFNESFATTIEQFGIERFLEMRGTSSEFDAYLQEKGFRQSIVDRVGEARRELAVLFEQDIWPERMREQKREVFARLTEDLRTLLTAAGRDADAWLERPFNNARVLSFALYEGRVPAFEKMLADCAADLSCFYAEAERVSKFKREQRDDYLDSLMNVGAL